MIESGTIKRRARKRYTCYGTIGKRAGWRWAETLPAAHQDAINPGDEYYECMDSAPGYQSGTRYCLACGKAFAGGGR